MHFYLTDLLPFFLGITGGARPDLRIAQRRGRKPASPEGQERVTDENGDFGGRYRASEAERSRASRGSVFQTQHLSAPAQPTRGDARDDTCSDAKGLRAQPGGDRPLLLPLPPSPSLFLSRIAHLLMRAKRWSLNHLLSSKVATPPLFELSSGDSATF